MLTELRRHAEAIARQAGAVLREHAARPETRVTYKSTAIDPVTEADKASEAVLIRAIRAAYPNHAILSEEGGGGEQPAAAPYCWVIDPLDGTVNFAHGCPAYAVNLAVVDAVGEPVVGVTYDPQRDECFSAARGGGAALNGQPIRVSRTETLLRALVATGFSYDSHTAADNNTAAWAAFIRRAQAARCTGSAALELAYVACGRWDGYWERKLHAWDMLAGILLVREAGGMATTFSGETAGLFAGDQVLASNGLIHQAMIDVLMEVRAGQAG